MTAEEEPRQPQPYEPGPATTADEEAVRIVAFAGANDVDSIEPQCIEFAQGP
jgi:hypothetical protein